jgi:hypothetical protein
VANTHWDDQGVQARAESGRLLRARLPAWAAEVERKEGWGEGKTLRGAVVLVGDLSTAPPFRSSSPSLFSRTELTQPDSTQPSLVIVRFTAMGRLARRRARLPVAHQRDLVLAPIGPL